MGERQSSKKNIVLDNSKMSCAKGIDRSSISTDKWYNWYILLPMGTVILKKMGVGLICQLPIKIQNHLIKTNFLEA